MSNETPENGDGHTPIAKSAADEADHRLGVAPSLSFRTRAIHVGNEVDPQTVRVPQFTLPVHFANPGRVNGVISTIHEAETPLARILKGPSHPEGVLTLAFSSGMAATTAWRCC